MQLSTHVHVHACTYNNVRVQHFGTSSNLCMHSVHVPVVCTCIGYILQHIIAAQAKPFSNGCQPLWSEGALCVNVHGFAFATTCI